MFLSAIILFSVILFVGRDAIVHGYIYDLFFFIPLIFLVFIVFILFYKGWKFPVPTEYIIFDDRVEARRGKKVISKVKFNSIKNVRIDREGPTAGKIMAGSIFIDITGGKAEKYVLVETEHIDIYLTPVKPDQFIKDLKEAIKDYKGTGKPQHSTVTEHEEYDASKGALFYLLFIKTPLGYFTFILPLYFLLSVSGFPIEIIMISTIACVSIFEFLIYFYSEKITSSILRTVPLKVFLSEKHVPTSFKHIVPFPIKVAPYMSLTNAMATGLTPSKSKIIVSQNFLKHSPNIQNAILRHEKVHINNKDILKLFLLSLVFNTILVFLVLIFPSTKIIGVTLFLWILILGIVVKSMELRADVTSVRDETEANELIKALTEISIEIDRASIELLNILGKEENAKVKILEKTGLERPKSIFRRIFNWIWIHPPIYIRINEIKNFKKYKSRSLLYFTSKMLHLMVTDIF